MHPYCMYASSLAGSNIDVHLSALESYVVELRDALALATALGRTLGLAPNPMDIYVSG